MILCDGTIRDNIYALVDTGRSENVTIDGLISQINPNSIDLTVSSIYKRPKTNDAQWTYGFQHNAEADRYAENCWKNCKAKSGFILLEPGAVVLAVTREFVKMPDNVCGQIFTKSTLGRMFINHMMAGVIDAGYSGRLTLELKNEGQHAVKIPVGSRVVQMVYQTLNFPAKEPYCQRNSRYQNAETVECAKMKRK